MEPEYQVVYTGDKVAINCNSIGYTTWLKDGVSVPSSFMIGNNIQISSATSDMSGVYKCQGVNNQGLEFEAEATLLVGGKLPMFGTL